MERMIMMILRRVMFRLMNIGIRRGTRASGKPRNPRNRNTRK